MALEMATDPADRSSTNLQTVVMTFHDVAENESVSINGEVFDSATRIVSQLQSWGMDNSTLEILQNSSAEYVYTCIVPNMHRLYSIHGNIYE